MMITPQVFNTDKVYVSIYDKPKLSKGRPQIIITDEIKAQRKEKAIEVNRKYYKNNREHCLLRQKLYDERVKNLLTKT